MGFFKRTNKKFDYQPRYYKGDNPYKIKHPFDEYRTTVGTNKSLKNKLIAAVDELKNGKGELNYTIIGIAAILFLIFSYIIDFDFSIFLPKN